MKRFRFPGARVERRTELLELLPRDSIGCEIGVWKGDFAVSILRAVRPSRLHLVDPWLFETDPAYANALYGGSSARCQADMDAIHDRVRRRLSGRIADGTVVVHRASSSEVAHAFPDGYFDWVYIDGNHLYEHVLQDLRSFTPKVRPGGLVTGDDYAVTGWWRGGVRRAVDEFVALGEVDAVSLDDQFVLRRLPGEASSSAGPAGSP